MKITNLITACLLLSGMGLNAQPDNDSFYQNLQNRTNKTWRIAQRKKPVQLLTWIQNYNSTDKGIPTGNYRETGTRRDNWNTLSSNYVFNDSTVNTYDANTGLITQILGRYYEQSSSAWVNSFKDTYSYSIEGWMSEEIRQLWFASAWDNFDKKEYAYNGSGINTEIIDYNWNSSAWAENYRVLNSINAQNLIEIETVFAWDNVSSSWDQQNRSLFNYTAQNKIQDEIYQNWNGSAWRNNWKLSYTYNASGKEIVFRAFDWDEVNNNWQNDYRDTVVFTPTGYIKTYFEWNDISLQWEMGARSIVTVNASELPEQEVYQYWNPTLGLWENNSRVTFTYDSNENTVLEFYESWDDVFSLWGNQSQVTNQFNADNYLLYNHYQYWNESSSSWVNAYRNYYRYEINPFASLNFMEDLFSIFVFPNPASEWVSIAIDTEKAENTQINFYNMHGALQKSIQTNKFSDNQTLQIPICDLNTGIYLIEIKNTLGSVFKKLIKQ